MALDVMRHRLVLSFEALSDDVTADRILSSRSSAGSPCPVVPLQEHVASSASAPERILQRLDWQVVRRLDGLLQGDYRSLFHGTGLDFAALREYQFGDDVRTIDWNVTARMDTPYVREYHEDRDSPRGSCSTSARRSTSGRSDDGARRSGRSSSTSWRRWPAS